MFKKSLSVLLAVLMVVSVMAVGVASFGAVTTDSFTPDPTKLYFDVDGTGWTMGSKDKIAFYMAGGDFDTETNATKPNDWGAKKLVGKATAGEKGIFEIDPTSVADKNNAKYVLTPGVQYKIVFARVSSNNWKEQTGNLFFTTDCLGHVAYSDGTTMENDVDSTKTSLTALWRGIDPAVNGPELLITSIGNVVGSCPEMGKTPYDIFVEFFTKKKEDFGGKTTYQNAHFYTIEQAKAKSEQKMVDDIAAALGLTKDDVKKALDDQAVQDYFAESGLGCDWSYDASPLPAGEKPHEHTPGEPVQENVKEATCTEDGSYEEVVYCTECGEEISRETKTIPATGHTPGEAVKENVTDADCETAGGYDEVVYCTICKTEISRNHVDVPAKGHTPGEEKFENVKEPTCTEDGSYDVVVYCDVCGKELSRKTEIDPAEGHTTTAPVKENEVEADCENAGGYDEVIYCGNCGEVISSTHVNVPALGHDVVFVKEVPATASVDGMKAHYECTRCHKLFADETGTIEVAAEDLVIKAAHMRGDANGDGGVDTVDATVIQRVLVGYEVPGYDEIAADADLDEEVDIIDATLIQRVDLGITTFAKWDERHPKG